MHIVEETSVRLRLVRRRLGFAVVMVVFTLLSVLMLVNLLIQTIQRLDVFNTAQWVAFVVWTFFALLMTLFGLWTLNSAVRGTSLTLDRAAETVTLQRARRFGREERTWAIYSIAGLEVQHNADMRLYALFLVLRSGERLALVSGSSYEAAQLRALTDLVRRFLHAASDTASP